MPLSDKLIITPPVYFKEPSDKCGYCHGDKAEKNMYSLDSWEANSEITAGNCTLGFHCESITIETYDKLCNNGWRRSGNFIYKPDLLRTCCRLYTIRTKPDQVQLTKEMKSVVKKFRKFIDVEPTLSNTDKKKKNEQFAYIKEILNISQNNDKFHTIFEPATYSIEKYELYSRYQETIHNDFKHSPSSFKRFLCDSPFNDEIKMGSQVDWDNLNNWYKNQNENESLLEIDRLGPTHECYFYEDKLIALAILDFLPSGVSSVYFIWDPDFKKLSLGKLSALRELTLLSRLYNRDYYYLGYYIEDCHKMNYKSQYGGELLDLINLEYVNLNWLQEQKMLQDGRLFTLGNSNIELQKELPINNSLANKNFSTMDNLSNKINISEILYGKPNGLAYVNTDSIVKDLKQYHINYDSLVDENKDVTQKLPLVMPGLLPMWELLDLFKENKISEVNGNLLLYDLQEQQLRPILSLEDEETRIITIVSNLIRVLGLEETKNTLIII